jgi:FixJ family two-component response regulator
MQAIHVQTHTAFLPHPVPNRILPQSVRSTHIERTEAVVHLVALDPRIHQEISKLLAARGVEVIGFASGAEYLLLVKTDTPACLILDMDLPDHGALDLQRRAAEKTSPPIVFIGGQCDIRSTVSAMKAGAIEFLIKPIDPRAFDAAIQTAIALDRKQRQKKAAMESLRDRYSLLTPRERQVFPLVIGGLLNKQAASVLGISEITLQTHRARVMRKMEASSFAELVRIAIKLRLPHWIGGHQEPALQARQICSPAYRQTALPKASAPPGSIFS